MLIHAGMIPHYRVAVYNHFHRLFKEDGLRFGVASHSVEITNIARKFELYEVPCSLVGWLNSVRRFRPQYVIIFSGIRRLFIFPFILLLKAKGIAIIYWGHGINLQKPNYLRPIYRLLHSLCDALILYSNNLKSYIHRSLWDRVFVAPNTLAIDDSSVSSAPSKCEPSSIMHKYGIRTQKNIIYVGRMQKRKNIPLLIAAHSDIDDKEIGLILVGPDTDNVLPENLPDRVIHIPATYGSELHRIMHFCDVFCCPGPVGLNIVEAMACGLPFVTIEDKHGPEVMYLKDDYNGLIIQHKAVSSISSVLEDLLNDNDRLSRLSESALYTYRTQASIENMYRGFREALNYLSCRGI